MLLKLTVELFTTTLSDVEESTATISEAVWVPWFIIGIDKPTVSPAYTIPSLLSSVKFKMYCPDVISVKLTCVCRSFE